jgi:superfamily II DNA or RNA helicase
MWLICSPSLSAEDIQAIETSQQSRLAAFERSLIADLAGLLASPIAQYRTKAFATLLTHGVLRLKIAVPVNGDGIYHEKLGLFLDSDEAAVSFIGSANETLSAWSPTGNFESIEVFNNWGGKDDCQRVERHREYLKKLWNDAIQGVEVFEPPEKFVIQARAISEDSIDILDAKILNASAKKRVLLPHQRSALDAWIQSGRRGIFEHATGSGKTFTAIAAIREHVAHGLPAIVVVPSILLLMQWRSELLDEIPQAAILSAGGDFAEWRAGGILEAMTDPLADHGPRVTLATLQTASSKEFVSRVSGGSHLLFVADEVHATGSDQYSYIFNIDSGPRLGLSATPTRFGDPVGTQKLLSYFGEIVQPPFSLLDAIQSGRLVQYEYFPHEVRLDEDETQQWKDVTRQIIVEIGSDESGPLTTRAKLLLIKRSRIAKKASGKVALARRVIKDHFDDGQRWLIYCEDSEQLGKVSSEIARLGIPTTEYHSSMEGSRAASLKWFVDYGGILVSIKCLDEGIDIPSVSHALILASSQNPRQFIQRRGRVLRVAQGKDFATVHDTLVLPSSVADAKGLRSLLKSEFSRALTFADHAMNRSAKLQILDTAASMEINLHGNSAADAEDDDDLQSDTENASNK